MAEAMRAAAPARVSTAERAAAEGAVLLMILGWWLTARDLPAFVLPGPLEVGRAMLRFLTDTGYALHAATSFARVVASVVVAMALAVALAALVRAVPLTQAIVERRILTFLNSFPSVGWAILGVVWFQVSAATVIFIQTAIVLPFCLVNALEGFRQIDPELDELGRSLTRNPIRRFTRVTLPLVAPFLVAGARIAYGIAWKIALVSELFGASSGLGYLLMRAQSTADAATVFACCFVIVLIFGLTDRIALRPLAQRFSRNRGGPS
ncbi:MAG: ABC transporter permease subunit [Pseudomonadota bacterium]|nr:ABC transporter permease subunit [Pseudomonadota bacterium]